MLTRRLGVNEATYHELRRRFGHRIKGLAGYSYGPGSEKEFPNGYEIQFPSEIEQQVLGMITELDGFVPDIKTKLYIAGAHKHIRDGISG